MRNKFVFLMAFFLFLFMAGNASASLITYDNGAGLSGTAEFTSSGNTLKIVLTNTSTIKSTTQIGGLDANENAASLLTSIAFELPSPSFSYSSGTGEITSGSHTINFDAVSSQLIGGDTINPEWGFGLGGLASAPIAYAAYLDNVSTLTANANAWDTNTADNLDGTAQNLDGPQGGLTNFSDWGAGSNQSVGAIFNSATFYLTLTNKGTTGLGNYLDYIGENSIIEFGSAYKFVPPSTNVPTPEPATMFLFGVGLVGLAGLRKKFVR